MSFRKVAVRVINRAQSSIFSLWIGVIIGFLLSYIILTSSRFNDKNPESIRLRQSNFCPQSEDASMDEYDDDELREIKLVEAQKKNPASKVNVLCWVTTSPNNHEKKAKHVKATWGKRCNTLLFMSSQNDSKLPTIGLHVNEGRDNLWAKTKEGLKYVYNNYLEKADWFLKADDDTYIILENLRYMLADYNSSYPHYLGCRLQNKVVMLVKEGFMEGGAYVLSREALKRLVEDGLPNPKICSQAHDGPEDVELGIKKQCNAIKYSFSLARCLLNLNILPMDTRDSLGRLRFVNMMPSELLIGDKNGDWWFWNYSYYPVEQGLGCCSDAAVSFHWVPPDMLYLIDYLLYNFKLYDLPTPSPLVL